MKNANALLALGLFLVFVLGACSPAPGVTDLGPAVQADGNLLIKQVYLLEMAPELNFRPTSGWPGNYVIKFVGYRCVQGASSLLAAVQYQDKFYYVLASAIEDAVNVPRPKC